MLNKIFKSRISSQDYRNSVRFFIPFDQMLTDELIMLKYGGFAKVLEITNNDLDYRDDLAYELEQFNRAFMQIKSGFTIHYETQRIPIVADKEEISSFAPLPTVFSQNMRNEKFAGKDSVFFKTCHYITISYLPTVEENQMIDKLLSNGPAKGETKAEYLKIVEKEIQNYENEFNSFIYMLSQCIRSYKVLKGKELLSYLYNTINVLDKQRLIKMPPKGYHLDDYLSLSQVHKDGDHIMINDSYMKVVTVSTYPSHTTPRVFDQLENLRFPLRICYRYIALGKEDSIKIANKYKDYHYAKRNSFLRNLVKYVNGIDAEYDGDKTRIKQSMEAEQARDQIQENQVSYGYYTFSVIIFDKNLDRIKKKVEIVKNIIKEHEFIANEDQFNTMDSFFGAIPGNIASNLRKVPISTKVLSYLFPCSSILQGDKYMEHWGNNQRALMTTSSNNQIFYFNNYMGDVGHTIVTGMSGSGKSVLLANMAMNFLKYESDIIVNGEKKKVPSQVFFFDKDSSSRVLTRCVGGKFYDIGGNNLAFQPLRNIHDDREQEFAKEWITSLIMQEDKNLINIKTNEIIWNGILQLATRNIEDRTITNLIKYIQDDTIKEALRPYSLEGMYGKYFDNNNDVLEKGQITTFEMGNIMDKPKVLLPILDYLFHKIEKEMINDGRASMIILDECWVFLQDERFSKKIEEWLRVLRKKNTSVVFATQQLEDINKSSISHVIKNNCPTKIFLPNRYAATTHKELYRGFNLSDMAIQILSVAMPKRDYLFVKSSMDVSAGSSLSDIRLFELVLSDIELAYTAMSDIQSQQVIDNIFNISSDNGKNINKDVLIDINKKWLLNCYNNGKVNKSHIDQVFKNIK